MSTSRALTSELSLKTESRLYKYILVKLGRMKNQLIMYIVFSALAYPLFAIGMLSYFSGRSSNFYPFSIFIFVVSLAGILMLSIAIPNSNFDYFSKKTVVDMNYSLPIKNSTRFWGDFLVGIVPVAVFYLISLGIGMLILFMGKDIFYEARTYTSLEGVKAEYAHVLSLFFEYAVLGLFALIGIYILTVFACVLSGRAFENWMVLFMLIIFIPGVTALFVVMPFVDVSEMRIEYNVLDITAAISPVMFVMKSFMLPQMVGIGYDEVAIIRNSNLIPYLIFLGVVLALSYFLGTRRDVERVGGAFAHKITSDIFLGALIFCIAALFCTAVHQDWSDSFSSIVTMIIITFIAFMVFEILTKRTFRRIHIGLIKYVGFLGGTAVISAVLFASNGFGIGYTIPNIDKIESVSISGIDTMGMAEYICAGDIYGQNFNFADPQMIEMVTEINKESNERDKRLNYFSINLDYILKNGDTVSRKAFVPYEGTDKYLSLLMSDEYKNIRLGYLKERLLGNGDKLETKTVSSIYARDLLGSDVVTLGNNVDTTELFEAYKKDIMVQTAEQVFENPQQPLFVLEIQIKVKYYYYEGSSNYHEYDDSQRIYVLPHHTNLRAALKKYISDDKIPQMELKGREVYLTRYDVDSFGNYGYIGDIEYGMNYNGYDKTYSNGVLLENPESNAKYKELISYAIPTSGYSIMKRRMTVIIDGNEYTIPDRHYDFARSIYDELAMNV